MARPVEPGGGGSSTFAAIDPDALKAVAGKLDAAQGGLGQLDRDLAAVLGDAGVSVDTSAVRNASRWAASARGDLQRRIDIALSEPDVGLGLDRYAYVDEATFKLMTPEQAYQEGQRLADKLAGKIGNDGQMIPGDVLDQLAVYQHDPDFTAGFFNRLGPARTARFPAWLMGVRANPDGQLVNQDHLNSPEDEERWLRTWATALATATRSTGAQRLADDFGRKMAEADAQGTGELLRFDENGRQLVFGRQFLNGVGDWMIPRMEQLKQGGINREELADKVGGGLSAPVWLQLGTSDDGKYQDFMVGYLEVIGLIPLPKALDEAIGEVGKFGIEQARAAIIDGAISTDYRSAAVQLANHQDEVFKNTVDVITLSVAHEYGLLPAGQDPVDWSRAHPGYIPPEEEFWKDGHLLTYERLAADPDRLKGLNDYLDDSEAGRELQKVSSRQLADFLWQLQHWQ